MLQGLARPRQGYSRRVSSFDVTGGNRDAWPIPAGDTVTLADIEGPGIIRHIWFTVAAEDPLYLRQCVLRVYWDGMEHPSVECPVGEFFGVGHAKTSSYSCAVMNMSVNTGDDEHGAMNCYWPMPFRSRATITVENQGPKPVRSWYFSIDYDAGVDVGDQLYFHAWWNRANPCPVAANQAGDDWQVNLSDSDNYLLLDAKGRGHYCGANLSVHNLLGGWWGEGDDMVMIDGQKWPPDIHGTGSEDWYNQAWGSQPGNAFPYNGVSYHSGPHNSYNERITVYRYHIADPIVFQKSIRVSIEHGHANDRNDDYSSVAFWYQTLSHRPLPPLPVVEERLPRPDVTLQPVDLPIRPEHKVSGSPFDPDL